MALIPMKPHSGQGKKLRNVSGGDKLVIAQPWSSGKANFKTVNVDATTTYDGIASAVKTTGSNGILNFSKDSGIIGSGTDANPIRLNDEWLFESYARGAMANVSQVGNPEDTNLPISGSYYSITRLQDGYNRHAVPIKLKDRSFMIFTPVTNGRSIRYTTSTLTINIGGVYKQTDNVYQPYLPPNYDSNFYYIDMIFCRTENYMVARYRHTESTGIFDTRDLLVLIETGGVAQSTYHTVTILAKGTLYNELVNQSSAEARKSEYNLGYGIVFDPATNSLYLTRETLYSGVNFSTIKFYKVGEANEYREHQITEVFGWNSLSGSTPYTAAADANAGGQYLRVHPGIFLPEDSQPTDSEIIYRDMSNHGVEFFTSTRYGHFSEQYWTVINDIPYLIVNRRVTFLLRPNIMGGSNSKDYVYHLVYRANFTSKTLTRVTKPEAPPVSDLWVDSVRGLSGSTLNSPTPPSFQYGVTRLYDNEILLRYSTVNAFTSAYIAFYPEDTLDALMTRGIVKTQNITPFIGNAEAITPVETNMYASPVSVDNLANGTEILMHRPGITNRLGTFVKFKPTDDLNNRYSGLTELSGYPLNSSRTPHVRLQNNELNVSWHVNIKSGSWYNQTGFDPNGTSIDVIYSASDISEPVAQIKAGNARQVISQRRIKSGGVIEVGELTLDYGVLAAFFDSEFGAVDRSLVTVSFFTFKNVRYALVHFSCTIGTTGWWGGVIYNTQTVGGVVTLTSLIRKQYTKVNNQRLIGSSFCIVAIITEESTNQITLFLSGGPYVTATNSSPQAPQLAYNNADGLNTMNWYSGITLSGFIFDKYLGLVRVDSTEWNGVIYTMRKLVRNGTNTHWSVAPEHLMLVAPFTESAFGVKVTESIPMFLGGINTTLEPQDHDLRDYFASVNNRRFYMYVTLVTGKATVEFTTLARADRVNSALIATIDTDAEKISRITAAPFIRVGVYRISTTAQGSAIPVTGGRSDEVKYTLWE